MNADFDRRLGTIERKLERIEDELHGKNGLGNAVYGIKARVTLMTALLVVMLSAILGSVIAHIFTGG